MTFDLFVKTLFERAAQGGIHPAEVYFIQDESLEVATRKLAIDRYAASQTLGLSLRGIVAGKMGYASTQVLDDDAIDMLIEAVIESATLTEEAEQPQIFAGSPAYPQVDTFDPALEAMATQDKISLAFALEKAATSQHPLVTAIDENVLQTAKSTVRIRNTFGLDLSHTDNIAVAYTEVMARRGDQGQGGSNFAITRDLKAIDPAAYAQKAVDTAVKMLDAAPLTSGPRKVVIDNQVMSDLLGVFASNFSAENAQKGLSLLKGRVGETVGSACVTLIDDPLLCDGLNARPFDAEGVATMTKAVIQEGVLKTLLHNLKTAKIDGVASTGNAAKASYSAPVRVSPSNLYLKPGETGLDQLLADTGEGLYVTEVGGLHAGADPISGDFSLIAKGYEIKGGKLAGAVNQVTVAGNLYTLLKDIQAVGSDLLFGFNAVGSPSVRVRELAVAGKS